jgi:hypothetical protein
MSRWEEYEKAMVERDRVLEDSMDLRREQGQPESRPPLRFDPSVWRKIRDGWMPKIGQVYLLDIVEPHYVVPLGSQRPGRELDFIVKIPGVAPLALRWMWSIYGANRGNLYAPGDKLRPLSPREWQRVWRHFTPE